VIGDALRLCALVVAALLIAGCGGTAGKGTVVGGIVPAGIHPGRPYVAGVVEVSDAHGHDVTTARVRTRHTFRLTLPPGAYALRAEYRGETCIGRAHVSVGTTVSANVICEGL
jgi:hypothetical protein